MDEFIHANRELWNAWTKIHEKSKFYDLEGFKAGKISLKSIELEELGDLQDKSLLHLQCHFGQDTLSLARLGAQVTGVDFSDKAICLARSLADELDISVRFIRSDIYDLSRVLNDHFDIIFTSYGVLAWLHDLPKWAEIISGYLKPGGRFYMVEFHPFSDMLDDWISEPQLSIRYPYFHAEAPMVFQAETSYAEPQEKFMEPMTNYQWSHSLSEILNALTGAGLHLEFLHEFPMTVHQQLPFMEEKMGWWRIPEDMPSVPLLFSLEARKPI